MPCAPNSSHPMRTVIASDHAGFALKQELLAFLAANGHTAVDVGTRSTDPCDYPDYAESLALAIRAGEAGRGILLCGSGIGASIAANKVPGIRAGVCHDVYSARQGVEHDDMNVLVLGARVIGLEVAKELVRAFLGAHFTNEDRHKRRLDKVKAIEQRYAAEQAKC